MKQKEFKTLGEQIEILKQRGLTFFDENKAQDILLRENYFFINGYRHLFCRKDNNHIFNKGTTFEEIYALFTFDRRLRNIIFKNVLIIENNIKSIISYRLSKKYGYRDKEYLKSSNFTQDRLRSRQVNDLISKMKRQVRVNGPQHSATLHYMNKYGYIPLWIMVKVLSFGIVGEMYSILKPEDQVAIADYYKISADNLAMYLTILSNYRNLCAHEDITYEHRTQREINNTKYHELLNIDVVDGEYVYGKNDLFALIIILKYMLTDSEFRLMVQEIDYELNILDGKVDSIPQNKILDRMGFPENYRTIIDNEVMNV